ncbi:NAD-dependent epimerase/dehydratase family protein [Chloroflexota bacterium]
MINGKKILVTGGAGFIGSNTIRALISNGAEVVIIDNLSTGREENIHPEAKFYRLNIADPQVEAVFKEENPHYVYHFAFNVSVPKSVENPLLDMDSISGSINILQNAKKYKIEKVFFVSSAWVYGNTTNIPTSENEPVSPVSPYVVSKHAVENYLWFYRSNYGLSYVIFRYPVVYGPGQVGGAMTDYIRRLASGQQAEIWGDGLKTRDYVYIDDVVRANLLAVELAHDYPDPIFNVGSSVETTLNDLYNKIARLLGKESNPIYLPDRPGELMRCCLDYSKIKRVLNWEPKVTLDEGLKERVTSYLRSF